MGARGKKRRRADGTVAGSRVSTTAIGARGPDEEFGPIPPELLLDAVSIYHRFDPIGSRANIDIEDMSAMYAEIAALADDEETGEALGQRAERLHRRLGEADGSRFFEIAGTGLSVDRDLLEHAATDYATDSLHNVIVWPREQSAPSVE